MAVAPIMKARRDVARFERAIARLFPAASIRCRVDGDDIIQVRTVGQRLATAIEIGNLEDCGTRCAYR